MDKSPFLGLLAWFLAHVDKGQPPMQNSQIIDFSIYKDKFAKIASELRDLCYNLYDVDYFGGEVGAD